METNPIKENVYFLKARSSLAKLTAISLFLTILFLLGRPDYGHDFFSPFILLTILLSQAFLRTSPILTILTTGFYLIFFMVYPLEPGAIFLMELFEGKFNMPSKNKFIPFFLRGLVMAYIFFLLTSACYFSFQWHLIKPSFFRAYDTLDEDEWI